ncbi:four helix bundle protein [bacterium]|nr:four helix bundle protein [bacterium]
MKKFRFLEWKVYNDSQEFLSFILKLLKKVPTEYRFELNTQLVQSAFSVVLNIAEGAGKTSDKELNRFLDIALGSLHETLAGVDALYRNKFVSKEDFDHAQKFADEIGKQLGGLKKKLKS